MQSSTDHFIRTDEFTPMSSPGKALYGGKGWGLLEMAQIPGVEVPPAFILTTSAWKTYRETGAIPVDSLTALSHFLDDHTDAMMSVRSGAPVSMPGMMDTLLNVGVDAASDDLFPGAYRRFATAWLDIVKNVPKARLKDLLGRVDARAGDDPVRFRALLGSILDGAEQVTIPDGRYDQIVACIKAVFDSWDTERAKVYRKMHNIAEDMGTACIVQRMVMGTAPGLSGSGVMFTRDPATGENCLKGEIAFKAQGEDVVSGAVTPTPLSPALTDVYDRLALLAERLEQRFGDVQDIEFTIESGTLYTLQTRTAKMSARARIITACDLAKANFPGEPKQQLAYLKQRVTRGMVLNTMTPRVIAIQPSLTSGLAASPGAVSGPVISAKHSLSEIPVGAILVADETNPDDFPVMAKSAAILTNTGGFTCHSAVVARGIGIPAVVGCGNIKLSGAGGTINGQPFKWGDILTLDGATGEVWAGPQTVKKEQPPRPLYELLHQIILGGGHSIPSSVYYLDCGIGQKVALTLDPSDLGKAEIQIERAGRLKAKGKEVGFILGLIAVSEDLFPMDLKSIAAPLVAHFGPDIKGLPIIYGATPSIRQDFANAAGMTAPTMGMVQVLDLLDMLT